MDNNINSITFDASDKLLTCIMDAYCKAPVHFPKLGRCVVICPYIYLSDSNLNINLESMLAIFVYD